MAKKSIVRIQGTGVPGVSIDVEVPVDHTYATDFARATYDYPDAQYIWIKTWDTEERARKASRAAAQAAEPSKTVSEGTMWIMMFVLLLIGAAFGGFDDETEPALPTQEAPETYEAPAPAAPSSPAPVYVPSPSSRPVYASEPRVTPVWEMDEDLTGNPDFTFND